MGKTETATKRGRPRSFDMEDVTAKAAHLFWQRGFEGVSVDELTLTMGITTQSFYTAFGSKQKLYRAALDWYGRAITEPIQAALRDEDDVVEAIRASFTLSAHEFNRADRPSGCMRSLAGLSASSENTAVAQLGSKLRLATTDVIEARLDQGVADGQFDGATDTHALAVYFNALLVGMAVSAHDGATTDELVAVAELAVSVLCAAGQRKTMSAL